MMSSASFGISGPNAPTISEKIVASTLNALQSLLAPSKIEQVCKEVHYPWRERVLSPAVTVLHMILAALWPEESLNASWQVQWAAVASRYPELAGPRGSLAKARKRLPLAVWEKLFAYLSETAQAWGEAFASWRGHRVVLLDGTCISMPAEPALFKAFGVNTGSQGKGDIPWPGWRRCVWRAR
jgi:putative transposase